MERRYGRRRAHGHRDMAGDPGLPTFDLCHVWPDAHVVSGVMFSSWVGVENLTGGDVHLRLWWPGYGDAGQKADLTHLQSIYVPAKDFGSWSIVVDSIEVVEQEKALDNIEFFWELTPVKA